MADPVSLALKGAGTAFGLCKEIYKLIQGIKKAPKDIRRVATDLRGFYGVLGALEGTISEQRDVLAKPGSAAHQLENVSSLLEECVGVFKELQESLQDFIALNGEVIRGKSEAFKWEQFQKEDVQTLRDHLSSIKLTLNIALTSLNLLIVARTGQEVSETLREVSKVRQDIQELRSRLDTLDKPPRPNQSSISARFSRNSVASVASLASLETVASMDSAITTFLDNTESIVNLEGVERQSSPGAFADLSKIPALQQDLRPVLAEWETLLNSWGTASQEKRHHLPAGVQRGHDAENQHLPPRQGGHHRSVSELQMFSSRLSHSVENLPRDAEGQHRQRGELAHKRSMSNMPVPSIRTAPTTTRLSPYLGSEQRPPRLLNTRRLPADMREGLYPQSGQTGLSAPSSTPFTRKAPGELPSQSSQARPVQNAAAVEHLPMQEDGPTHAPDDKIKARTPAFPPRRLVGHQRAGEESAATGARPVENNNQEDRIFRVAASESALPVSTAQAGSRKPMSSISDNLSNAGRSSPSTEALSTSFVSLPASQVDETANSIHDKPSGPTKSSLPPINFSEFVLPAYSYQMENQRSAIRASNDISGTSQASWSPQSSPASAVTTPTILLEGQSTVPGITHDIPSNNKPSLPLPAPKGCSPLREIPPYKGPSKSAGPTAANLSETQRLASTAAGNSPCVDPTLETMLKACDVARTALPAAIAARTQMTMGLEFYQLGVAQRRETCAWKACAALTEAVEKRRVSQPAVSVETEYISFVNAYTYYLGAFPLIRRRGFDVAMPKLALQPLQSAMKDACRATKLHSLDASLDKAFANAFKMG